MSVNMDPVNIARCFSEWPAKVQRAARDALRKELRDAPKVMKSNSDADVLLEQTWNAICAASGHDTKKR